MTHTDDRSRTEAPGDWSLRLAGGLLAAVGGLNVVLGLLSLLTDMIQLSAGVAGGLVAAGLVTAALGALVWRGSRPATLVALTVFGLLLVVQLGDVAADAGTGGDELAQNPAVRFGVLALLVATLGLATWRLRRKAPARTRR